MRLKDMRRLSSRLLPAFALISMGCLDFHQTGTENPTPVVRPMLVSVTVEYRQPNLCSASDRCDDNVVLFASWLPMTLDPQGRQTGGYMFLSRVSAYAWRGVAQNVPVNYPPKDDPHVVAIYDPHLRDTPTNGVTASRLIVGQQNLTNLINAGTPRESAFVYVDENGYGHNPF